MSALRSLSSLTTRAGVRSFGAAAAAAPTLPAFIAGAPEAVVTSAAGGLKIGSITTPGETATVTAWVEAGSRYETPETNGVANLFELSAIASKASEIAALGGMVSSHTSREHIVFEAKVLKENVGAATKLLGELVSGKLGDVAASKAAMLATLEAANASPEEVLFEHLHDAAYLDTPMGMSVLGTPETVNSLTAADVAAFQASFMTPGRTVVAASGNVDAKEFASAAASAFSGLPSGPPSNSTDVAISDLAPATFTGSDKRIRFDSKPAAYVAIAFEGVKAGAPDQVPLMVLGAYLGGYDSSVGPVLPKNMTSKLATDQGEQEAASVLKVVNANYKDSGLFGVYFQSPDNRVEDSMWYTLWNLVRMVHKTTEAELQFAQNQLKEALLQERSTTAGSAACLAKDLASYGRPVSLKELFARIDAVKVDDVKAVAKKVINDQDHALAAVGAIYELPDYNWIRRRSHWLRY